jgi:Spy/CpxP family protein refolding chaperone
VAAGVGATHTAYAQGRRGNGQGKGEARLEQLAKELSLTAEQKEQIKDMMANQTAVREQNKTKQLTQAEWRQQMKAERRVMQEKMKAILTPDQWAKWQQMKADRKAARGSEGEHPEQP